MGQIRAIEDGRLCPTDREAALAELWRRVAELDEFLDAVGRVSRGGSAVDPALVQELVALVREQQDSLLAAWHGQDTVTEDLRTVVQHYRAFGTRLADFCREG